MQIQLRLLLGVFLFLCLFLCAAHICWALKAVRICLRAHLGGNMGQGHFITSLQGKQQHHHQKCSSARPCEEWRMSWTKTLNLCCSSYQCGQFHATHFRIMIHKHSLHLHWGVFFFKVSNSFAVIHNVRTEREKKSHFGLLIDSDFIELSTCHHVPAPE